MDLSPTQECQTNVQNQQPNNHEPIEVQEPIKTKANNGEQEKNLNKESQKSSKRRNRERSRKEKEDPMTIVQNILSKTNYKEANLSQIVDQKFRECPYYTSELKQQLQDVNYASTVGEVLDSFSDVNISVLPDKFEGCVNANPFSKPSLPCLYQRPPINRWKDKRLRAKSLRKNRENKINN